MSRSIDVSVVLPAYNEEDTIGRTVETTLAELGTFLPPGTFEVIVAEDGCDDRTAEIAERLASRDERVRHLHSDDRLGRGGALERAFRAAHGSVLVYFDTDLATDLRHLEELVESVRSDGYDVATGSRRMAGQVADRPLKRDVASRGFNGLVRLFLRSDLRDHQCGFKAFDRDAFVTLADVVEDDHWFWDTEVLVRAQRAGYRVREFPVDWEPKGDTKVDLVRDVLGMGSQILRTWWQLGVQPRLTRSVSVGAGVLLTVAALGLMLVYLDPAVVLEEMGNADRTLIAVAALIYLASWPVRGWRYRDILAELGYRDGLGLLTGAVFISQTGNLVFPARAGDAIRAYVVKARRAVPYSTGFASLAVERVVDMLTLALLAVGAIAGLVATGAWEPLVGAVAGAGRAGQIAVAVAGGVGLVAVGVIGVLVAVGRTDRRLLRAGLARLGSDTHAVGLAAPVERFVRDVRDGISSPVSLGRVGVASVVVWLLDVATAVAVLVALTGEARLASVLTAGVLAVSVGNLAKVLPLSPGGIGLYEAAFTALIVGLTPIVAPVAFSAAVIDHAVKNVVTVVGGVASMLLLNVSLTTAADEGARRADAIAVEAGAGMSPGDD